LREPSPVGMVSGRVARRYPSASAWISAAGSVVFAVALFAPWSAHKPCPLFMSCGDTVLFVPAKVAGLLVIGLLFAVSASLLVLLPWRPARIVGALCAGAVVAYAGILFALSAVTVFSKWEGWHQGAGIALAAIALQGLAVGVWAYKQRGKVPAVSPKETEDRTADEESVSQ